jgi:hypothetical protein
VSEPKVPWRLTKDDRTFLRRKGITAEDACTHCLGKGCLQCLNTGEVVKVKRHHDSDHDDGA